jgi:hypothetical protein
LANSAASPIVFNGLLTQGGVVKVSHYNPNTGDAKWVQVGKQLGSYTVGYQPGVPGQTPDAVILTLGTSSQRITLKDANLTANASAITTTSTSEADTTLARLADQLRYEQEAGSRNTGLERILTDMLAQQRANPNADPRLIQMLETRLSAAAPINTQ